MLVAVPCIVFIASPPAWTKKSNKTRQQPGPFAFRFVDDRSTKVVPDHRPTRREFAWTLILIVHIRMVPTAEGTPSADMVAFERNFLPLND